MASKKISRAQMSLLDNPGPRTQDSYTLPELPVLNDVDEVGYDTEGTGLMWWEGDYVVGAAVAYRRRGSPRIETLYAPLRHKQGPNIPVDKFQRWAKEQLGGKKLVTLNGRYDVHMSKVDLFDPEVIGCSITDVGHSAALLDDHRTSFSLENISMEYLGEGKDDGGIDKLKMVEYHASQVEHYGRTDARLTLENRERMLPLLADQDLMEVQGLEDRLIYAVVAMEENGVNLDADLLKKYVRQSEQELNRLIYQMHDALGFKVNPTGRADCDALFDKIGLPRPEIWEYYAGQKIRKVSYEHDALAPINHPTVALLRRARDVKSLRAKFIVRYWNELKKWGVLRYALHQLASDDGGTVSGRFSSSGLVKNVCGVNIQQVSNVKKQIARYKSDSYIIRKLFIPRNGRMWIAADAKQIEYRLFAHYAKNPAILRAYKEDPNTDFHNKVMEIFHQVKPSLTRERAKDINFALIYGAGLEKMAEMMKVTEGEADEIRTIYFSLMPEVKDLLHRAARKAKEVGYVKTIMGRRARFPGGQFSHKAFNRVVQGGAADIAKKKTVELHDLRKELDLIMYFVVHDEMDGDVPDEEAGRKVAEVLDRQTTDLLVPILWDTHTGKNWAEAK